MLPDIEAGANEVETRKRRLELYQAALDGDWNTVEVIYDQHPEEINAFITKRNDTVLHIAVAANKMQFVEKLIRYRNTKEVQGIPTTYEVDLTIANNAKNTAFCLAAASGNVQLVRALLNEKNDLKMKRGASDMLPIYMAALSGHREVVWCLYEKMENEMKEVDPTKLNELFDPTRLNEVDLTKLFVALIDADVYDVALQMLRDQPYLATARVKDNLSKGTVPGFADHGETKDNPPNKKAAAAVGKTEGSSSSRGKAILAVDEIIPETGDNSSSRSGKAAPVLGETALHVFARKSHMPSNAFHQTPMGFLNKCIDTFLCFCCIKERSKEVNNQARMLIEKIWEVVISKDDNEISRFIGVPSRLIFTAAKKGNYDFLEILIRSYPDLIFKVDSDRNKYSIFHYAILYRHENIFKLIHEIGSIKDVITTYKDKNRNNMLHLAASMPEQSLLNVVPGAALQLQRELLWFEEVKKSVQPRHLGEENVIDNKPGKLPEALFMETHEPLRREGEKWMKETASSCVIVAVLIATVVFAAAFTVPGGLHQETGVPVFIDKVAFKLFMIFDALSLVFSTTSVLTFLSILTSRYAVADFLSSLPNKLIIGLLTLFISILTMMISFMAAFFVIFRHKLLRIAIPIAVVAVLPIVVFVCLHARLFFDVCKSTYFSKSLFKPNKKRLFSKRGKEKSWWPCFRKSKTS